MTRLRKVMLEELQRRNFSEATIRAYIGAVERFARYFGKPPDKLGPEHIREWQAYLLHKRKLAVGTVVAQTAGLRFFFVRTLKRRFPPDSIPYPKYTHHRVPKVLSPEEVAQAHRCGQQSPGASHPDDCSTRPACGAANWSACVWRTSTASA